jgi:hypothetical protein
MDTRDHQQIMINHRQNTVTIYLAKNAIMWQNVTNQKLLLPTVTICYI